MTSQGVLAAQSGAGWKLLAGLMPLHAGMGSFDCAAASHSRSSRFAQDDRGRNSEVKQARPDLLPRNDIGGVLLVPGDAVIKLRPLRIRQ
jgi:hypothetical protein